MKLVDGLYYMLEKENISFRCDASLFQVNTDNVYQVKSKSITADPASKLICKAYVHRFDDEVFFYIDVSSLKEVTKDEHNLNIVTNGLKCLKFLLDKEKTLGRSFALDKNEFISRQALYSLWGKEAVEKVLEIFKN